MAEVTATAQAVNTGETTRPSSTLGTVPPPGPDLRAAAVEGQFTVIPDATAIGAEVVVPNMEIRNIGGVAAGTFHWRYYLFSSAPGTADFPLNPEGTVSALDAGASVAAPSGGSLFLQTGTGELAVTADPGTYRLGLRADDGHNVPEGNEGNNEVSALLRILPYRVRFEPVYGSGCDGTCTVTSLVVLGQGYTPLPGVDVSLALITNGGTPTESGLTRTTNAEGRAFFDVPSPFMPVPRPCNTSYRWVVTLSDGDVTFKVVSPDFGWECPV